MQTNFVLNTNPKSLVVPSLLLQKNFGLTKPAPQYKITGAAQPEIGLSRPRCSILTPPPPQGSTYSLGFCKQVSDSTGFREKKSV